MVNDGSREEQILREWDVVESEERLGDGNVRVVPVDVEVPAGQIRVGADSSCRLYVYVPVGTDEDFDDDRTGQAVHLERDQRDGQDYLVVSCRKPELNPAFRQFGLDLIAAVEGEPRPSQKAIEELDQWRRLLAWGSDSATLDPSKIKGLIGELLVLEKLAEADAERSLEAWTGPGQHQHDFCFPGAHLEVKATENRSRREPSISSVEQLQAPPGGSLHLIHFQLESDPTGDTLADLCKRILDLGVLRFPFLQRLSESGYTYGTGEEIYAGFKYRVVERRCYDTADESFPRLTPDSFPDGRVPPGVMDISYRINLSGESPSPLSRARTDSLLKELASG